MGLTEKSMLGVPVASALLCVAGCPFDLSVKQLIGGNKAAFSPWLIAMVWMSSSVHLSHGDRGCNAGTNKLALVAADGERQCWAGVVHRANIAVRNKAPI